MKQPPAPLSQEPTRAQRIALAMLKPKIAIPLAFIALLLIAPLIYRSSRLSGLPDIPPPFDVEKYDTVAIDPKENAFEFYKQASGPLHGSEHLNNDDYDKVMEEGWQAASEDIRTWVSDNRAAFALWLKGAAAPDALYHQPKELRIDTLLPMVMNQYEFARLAKLEAARLEAEGKPAAAWDMYRAIFRSSRHCGRHGTIIERLIGIGFHSMAVDSMTKWSARSDVDVAMLRRALEHVSEDYELTPPASDALRSEYFVLMNLYDRLELSSADARGLGDWGRPIADVLPAGLAMFLFNEPELSRRVTKHAFANWLAQIDNPRHARTETRAGELTLFDPEPAGESSSLAPQKIDACLSRTLFLRNLMPALVELDRMIGREQAKQACLIVILAAQAYQRDHGEFPEELEDLRDGYLDEVPADPYGKVGETIRYRRNGARAVVWSIFENGRDDGGADVQVVPGEGLPTDIGYEFSAPGAAEAQP
ncbi:MAG: hypothetical protein CMJ48_14475 [Planctomycetaceae bacterium]|nr:hypothetical protein [Planctomycetaceae bacterium]